MKKAYGMTEEQIAQCTWIADELKKAHNIEPDELRIQAPNMWGGWLELFAKKADRQIAVYITSGRFDTDNVVWFLAEKLHE